MNRYLCIAAIALFTGYSAKAQVTYGVRGGTAISNVRGSAITALSTLTDITGGAIGQSSFTSFYAGGFVNIPMGSVISIEPGVTYAQTGTSLQGGLYLKGVEFLGIGGRAVALSHTLEVPLLLKAKLAKGFSVYAGPQLNYLFSNNLTVRASVLGISVYKDKYDINNMYEPVNMSVSGGVQYQFPAGLTIEAGYQHGVTRIIKEGSMDVYGKSFRVGLSYPLNFRQHNEY